MQQGQDLVVTNNTIIRIHHPVLTEEEQAQRMKEIEKAAINLVRANRRAEAAKLERNKNQ